MKNAIREIVKGYKKSEVSIGTLGSHSALNIFKGAKEEGFRTVCVCRKSDSIVYRKFKLADEMIFVNGFGDILRKDVQKKLRDLNTVLIPHGSFNAYVGTENMMNALHVPMFGNRKLLHFETGRERQREWLKKAGLTVPRTFNDPKEINGLIIAKFPGAKGGRGYFLASSTESFHKKAKDMVKRGQLKQSDIKSIYLQEYILGVNIYPLYFRSLLKNEVELLGMDRRYESAVDNLGRIPASEQLQVKINPSYTVIGNIPITVRESLLPEILRMGDSVARVSKRIAPPGIVGPFCLETVITDDLKIVTFEISARIVAGSNVGIGGSPYSYLNYGERMYIGKRIAMEIRQALNEDKLEETVF